MFGDPFQVTHRSVPPTSSLPMLINFSARLQTKRFVLCYLQNPHHPVSLLSEVGGPAAAAVAAGVGRLATRIALGVLDKRPMDPRRSGRGLEEAGGCYGFTRARRGEDPTGIVASTVLLLVSMTETVSSLMFVT
jgi:hypothetical protein